MRIGLNLLYLVPGQVGGTEIYAKGLLYGLSCLDTKCEFIVYVNKSAASWPLPKKSNFHKAVCPISGVVQSQRYFYEQTKFPTQLNNDRIELVHSLGYIGPLFIKMPSVVTVHDLNFVSLRSIMPLKKIIVRALFITLSAHRANQVISVSEFSKNEICRYLAISPKKLNVIHESVYQHPSVEIFWEKICHKYGLDAPYILAFSSHSKHKNIDGLLSAYSRIKKDIPHNLVIIGHVPSRININKIKKDFDLHKRLIETGYIPDEFIKPILSHASLLVFPSFYEGFGLPLLEAQAVGVPVVCSNAGSLPEIGGSSVIYFDPKSIIEIAQKIGECINNSALADKIIAMGKENVKRFSWHDTAKKTLEVYNGILKKVHMQ